MSDVTLFRDAKAVIPDYMKNGVDDFTKKLMSSANGGKSISIRGSVFRMIVDGKEIAQNEDRAMDVVIVNVAEHTSRTYYSGTYQEGQTVGPDCWSNDGKVPDPRAENPQSTKCEGCPMNIAGAGSQKGRPCRFSRRLAVVMGNDVENSDVYRLVLPAQSIFGKGDQNKMPFLQYIDFLGSWNLSLRGVVTEMKFDTSSATPKLIFRPVRPLEQWEYEAAVAKGDSPEAIQAISYNPVAATPKREDAASPFAAKPKAQITAEPAPEPQVREKKTGAAPKDLDSVIAEWGDDD